MSDGQSEAIAANEFTAPKPHAYSSACECCVCREVRCEAFNTAVRLARAHKTLADRLRKIADEVQAMGGET
jgi:hypothetical protein